MKPKKQNSKSCAPKDIAIAPTTMWSVEDIGAYAQKQNDAINDGERSLTTLYWLLGLALELARNQFSHSQWGLFLESIGVSKTRASKARAIHATFETEERVAGLSVEEAYQRRQRRSQKSVSRKSAIPKIHAGNESAFEPVKFLVEICRGVEFCVEQVESATPELVSEVLSAVDEAISELQRLRSALDQRAVSV